MGEWLGSFAGKAVPLLTPGHRMRDRDKEGKVREHDSLRDRPGLLARVLWQAGSQRPGFKSALLPGQVG